MPNNRIIVQLRQVDRAGDFIVTVIEAESQSILAEKHVPSTFSAVEHYQVVEWLDEHVNLDESKQQQNIIQIGQALFDLIGGDALRQFMKRMKDSQQSLDIVLNFPPSASEFWNQPWELLHDGQAFITLDARFTLLRQPLGVQLEDASLATKPVPRPLKVLVVLAEGKDATPINLERQIQTLLEALRPARQRELVMVEFVEEGSLEALRLILIDGQYHILHFVSQSGFSPEGAYLMLEDPMGNPRQVYVSDLLPVVRDAQGLQLVILSNCQTTKLEQTRATHAFASALMPAVPSVLAMPLPFQNENAKLFYQTFYGAVGSGYTLENAIQMGRETLYKRTSYLAIWGVPALYQHHSPVQLADPSQHVNRRQRQQTGSAMIPLSKAPVFVERRHELRQLRHAINIAHTPSLFIWGMAGVGKSTLARRIIEDPANQQTVQEALVIPCQHHNAADAVSQVIDFLGRNFPKTASSLNLYRTRPNLGLKEIIRIVQGKRLMIVFDGFDAYLQEDSNHQWKLSNPLLEQFFQEISSADWSITCLYTSRQRWKSLDNLPSEACLELHLPMLSAVGVGMLLGQLEGLSKQDPETIQDILHDVGGHPKMLMTVDGAIGKKSGLLQDIDFKKKLISTIEKNYLAELIKQLEANERKAFIAMCPLRIPFTIQQLQEINKNETVQSIQTMLEHWLSLSLVNVHPTNGEKSYHIPQMVRSYVLSKIKAEQQTLLHASVAEGFMLVYRNVAYDRYQRKTSYAPIEHDPFRTARQETQLMLRETRQQAINTVLPTLLEWRYHYMQSKQFEQAAQLAHDLWQAVAFQQADIPLANTLLKESIETASGESQWLAQLDFAHLLENIGKKEEALKYYERMERNLTDKGENKQLALVKVSLARLYSIANNPKKAHLLEKDALDLAERARDQQQVIRACLLLVPRYVSLNDPKMALETVLQAEKVAQKYSLLDQMGAIVLAKASLLASSQKAEETLALYREAYKLADRFADTETAWLALIESGRTALALQRASEAEKFTLQGIQLINNHGKQKDLATPFYLLSQVYEAQGQNRKAVATAERAYDIGRQFDVDELKIIESHYRRLVQKN
ncbi:MAG: CHAT domain-containing protein [Phototrophicaceae bacterium]